MITTKQRAYLRGLANKVPALYQVGKGGVTENFITMILDSLEKNELIKITVLENSGCTPREICDEVIAATNAEPVQVSSNSHLEIGHWWPDHIILFHVQFIFSFVSISLRSIL